MNLEKISLISDKGIDPHAALFETKRDNEKLLELDCSISCLVNSLFWLCFPFTCCANIKTVTPMTDTIISKCGIVTEILREPGPYCVGFCCVETMDVYMGLNTIEINKKGANDLHGSPLTVSAQFVYRVTNSLNATFRTGNLEKFLTDQAESAMRAVLALYPYDVDDGHSKNKVDCLVKQSNHIDKKLVEVFQKMVDFVGVKIESFRLINVEYHQSVAKLLLARQEAQAEVTARTAIAEGISGIIKETVSHLKALGINLSQTELNKFATNLSLILVNHGHTTLNLFDGHA